MNIIPEADGDLFCVVLKGCSLAQCEGMNRFGKDHRVVTRKH